MCALRQPGEKQPETRRVLSAVFEGPAQYLNGMNQRQIAAEVGCSVATVNRVLAGQTSVNATLRAQVLAAAAARGYAPPERTPAKLDPRRRTVAVLLREAPTRAAGDLTQAVLTGIAHEARRRGLTAAPIVCAGPASEVLRTPAQELPGLREGLHCGAILWGWEDAELIRWVTQATPTVVIGNYRHLHEPWATLTINHLSGAMQMFDHLWSLGHRRIGFIHSLWAGHRGHERLGAYIQARAMHGQDARMTDVLDVEDERDFLRLVHLAKGGVSAWITDCHRSGLLAQQAFAKAGLDVPGEISLCSFLSMPTPAGIPPLTGVRGPFQALGRIAVGLLHLPSDAWEPGRRVLVDVEMEMGVTTGEIGST